ncbi:hypothetical protein ACFL6G_09115, partial [candidate division KSB1 bacterium]
EGIIAILIGLIAFFLPQSVDYKSKILIICCGIIFVFIIKLIRQLYNLFSNMHSPLKVVRKVQGEGAYEGKSVIVLENNGNLRDGLLLTLFSESSGAKQPLCLLLIIKAMKNEDILTIQFLPDEFKFDIEKYFEEDSRKKSLYALPFINYDEIMSFSRNPEE